MNKTRLRNLGCGTLLAILLSSPLWADTYVRNRLVTPSSQRGNTLYVERKALKRYLRAADIQRCQFDEESGEIRVDGKALDAKLLDGEIPLVELVQALGFQKRVNSELGIVDYVLVAPSKVSGAQSASSPSNIQARRSRNPEYERAGERMRTVLLRKPEVKNHPEAERVRSIGQKIAANSDMPNQPWNFLVVRDPSPNAFCCGAGWVAVTTGLLDLKLSDDELAGVLSHEVGHGCRKDLEESRFNRQQMSSLAQQVKQLEAERNKLLQERKMLLTKALQYAELAGQAPTASAAQLYLDDSKKASREAERLKRPIKKLTTEIDTKVKKWKDRHEFATASHYKQKDEYDADVKGLYYATRAGYNHEGLMDALTKIADAGAAVFGEAAYQGGFSHPPLKERIGTLRKVLRDWRSR